MKEAGRPRELTGRHVLIIALAAFGVILAANLTMLFAATGTFPGLVVKNSYVASQQFNGWLEEAREAEALGYAATFERDADGHMLVETKGVPLAALLSADMRRPLGKPEDTTLAFEQIGDNLYRSTEALDRGRWIARLAVESGAGRWVTERELP